MNKRLPLKSISDLDRRIIAALAGVKFQPYTGDGKFYQQIEKENRLSDKQLAYLYKIFFRYKRQISGFASLSLELEPHLVRVSVKFTNTLFGVESDIKINDLTTKKERWTKRDRR